MPSDPEAARRWLNDIRHHTAMAEGFVEGVSYDSFKDDNLRLYAVTRCLEIISEASRRLPDAMKARYPSITWREMAARQRREAPEPLGGNKHDTGPG